MTLDSLRAQQQPLKDLYKTDPARARWVLKAAGELDLDALICTVPTFAGNAPAGLHQAAGGTGKDACSGDMLLEALVACAGVTLGAVATAMQIPLRHAEILAEGDLDFRGTLGVAKDAPVGFEAIRLTFKLDSDADPAQLDKLVQLTERFCVIYQTLAKPPRLESFRA